MRVRRRMTAVLRVYSRSFHILLHALLVAVAAVSADSTSSVSQVEEGRPRPGRQPRPARSSPAPESAPPLQIYCHIISMRWSITDACRLGCLLITAEGVAVSCARGTPAQHVPLVFLVVSTVASPCRPVTAPRANERSSTVSAPNSDGSRDGVAGFLTALHCV